MEVMKKENKEDMVFLNHGNVLYYLMYGGGQCEVVWCGGFDLPNFSWKAGECA